MRQKHSFNLSFGVLWYSSALDRHHLIAIRFHIHIITWFVKSSSRSHGDKVSGKQRQHLASHFCARVKMLSVQGLRSQHSIFLSKRPRKHRRALSPKYISSNAAMLALYSSIIAASLTTFVIERVCWWNNQLGNKDCLACSQMLRSNAPATIMNHSLAEVIFAAIITILTVVVNKVLVQVVVLSKRQGIDDSALNCWWGTAGEGKIEAAPADDAGKLTLEIDDGIVKKYGYIIHLEKMYRRNSEEGTVFFPGFGFWIQNYGALSC